MTEVPVCESLRCVFFFFFLFSFLCDSWLGNGSGCFLEVVASSAGEKGGAYGISGQPSGGICTEEERNTNKRDQRHRAVFVESANIRVVSSVQI